MPSARIHRIWMTVGLLAVAGPSVAQTAGRDGIAEYLAREADRQQVAQSTTQPGEVKRPPVAPPVQAAPVPPAAPAIDAETTRDPREGDPAYEQAQRLMKAIDAVLQDTADNRGQLRKLPSKNEFVIPPIWT